MLSRLKSIIPGVMICILIALISAFIHHFFQAAGAAVIAMFAGMLVRLFYRIPSSWTAGLRFTSKQLLKTAIVFLGGTISLQQLVSAGSSSLMVMMFTLSGGFLAAWFFGTYCLRISFNQSVLIALGTGICGGSAIASLSPILDADDRDIAFAIAATFLFDVIAVVVFPLLGQMMNLSHDGYGLWVGTAVNDTSSVVAASYAYSDQAGNYATMVKMARTTMLLPIGILLNIVVGKRKASLGEEGCSSFNHISLIPVFILFFILMVVLNTLFSFSPESRSLMKLSSSFIISMALGAVGLNTDLKNLFKAGRRPLVLGGIVSIVVALVSIIVQKTAGLL